MVSWAGLRSVTWPHVSPQKHIVSRPIPSYFFPWPGLTDYAPLNSETQFIFPFPLFKIWSRYFQCGSKFLRNRNSGRWIQDARCLFMELYLS